MRLPARVFATTLSQESPTAANSAVRYRRCAGGFPAEQRDVPGNLQSASCSQRGRKPHVRQHAAPRAGGRGTLPPRPGRARLHDCASQSRVRHEARLHDRGASARGAWRHGRRPAICDDSGGRRSGTGVVPQILGDRRPPTVVTVTSLLSGPERARILEGGKHDGENSLFSE